MLRGAKIASRYVLQRKLGAGGMGQVWSAEHATTERQLAVKLILPGSAGAKVAKDRFLREARASARIGHPNVIDVFDAGELDDGTLYLAMELLEGMSLGAAMRASPPMALRDFLVAMADACRGLGAAHAVGIVHRDVKPENIFLHRERGAELLRAVVLDFGISKFLDNVDSVATVAGSLLGSPRFMSPEQVRGVQNADARADVWSIGVLIFRAVTGQWSHEGNSLTQLCISIGSQAPLDIDEAAPHVPGELRQLVKGCLAPLEERYPDASTLADELEAVAADPRVQGLCVSPLLADPESGITGESIRVRDPSLSTTHSRGRRSLSSLPLLPVDSGEFGLIPQSERGSISPDSSRKSAPVSESSGSMATPPPISAQSLTQSDRGMKLALIGVIASILLLGGYGLTLLRSGPTQDAAASAAAEQEPPAPPASERPVAEASSEPAREAAEQEPASEEPPASDPKASGDAEPEPVAAKPPAAPAPRVNGKTAKAPPPPPKPAAPPPPKPTAASEPKVVGENLGSGL